MSGKVAINGVEIAEGHFAVSIQRTEVHEYRPIILQARDSNEAIELAREMLEAGELVYGGSHYEPIQYTVSYTFSDNKVPAG